MFVRETIERCNTCRELTPHTRRRVALSAFLRGRRRQAGARCERCRGKRRAERLAMKSRLGFRLDRNTVTSLP